MNCITTYLCYCIWHKQYLDINISVKWSNLWKFWSILKLLFSCFIAKMKMHNASCFQIKSVWNSIVVRVLRYKRLYGILEGDCFVKFRSISGKYGPQLGYSYFRYCSAIIFHVIVCKKNHKVVLFQKVSK